MLSAMSTLLQLLKLVLNHASDADDAVSSLMAFAWVSFEYFIYFVSLSKLLEDSLLLDLIEFLRIKIVQRQFAGDDVFDLLVDVCHFGKESVDFLVGWDIKILFLPLPLMIDPLRDLFNVHLREFL